MGFSTEQRGIGPKVFGPGTGKFPNSTCIRTNQKEFVDNVVIQEPLGSSDHNQLHFNISIKSVKTKVKQRRRDFRKGN